MNEIKELLSELYPYILSLIISIITTITLLLTRKTEKAKIKMLEEQLDKARSNDIYCECPHCHSKIDLCDLNFYLPSGKIDNNLNGIPDDSES